MNDELTGREPALSQDSKLSGMEPRLSQTQTRAEFFLWLLYERQRGHEPMAMRFDQDRTVAFTISVPAKYEVVAREYMEESAKILEASLNENLFLLGGEKE
jgi:hypothetical protein